MNIHEFSHEYDYKIEKNLQNQKNELSSGYLNYLNSSACREVNPFSKNFWKDMTGWIEPQSKAAQKYPKDIHYRKKLSPYILQRVNLVASKWNIKICNEKNLRITLMNVRIAHVSDNGTMKKPKHVIGRMNIKVSRSWLDRVKPDPSDELSAHGVLYEYVNQRKHVRNIGVWPVALVPCGTCTDHEQEEYSL